MNADIIQRIDKTVEFLNPKQQIIANRLRINKNCRFFESSVNGVSEIFFEDTLTKEIYNFVSYIKSNCGCD